MGFGSPKLALREAGQDPNHSLPLRILFYEMQVWFQSLLPRAALLPYEYLLILPLEK